MPPGSSSAPPSAGRRSRFVRRLLMLCTAGAVGAVGWTLLGEAESAADRDEIVARVDGVEVTEQDLEREVSAELAALDAARRRLLSDALEHRVREVLIEHEARRRGLDRARFLALEVDGRLDEISLDAAREYLEGHGDLGGRGQAVVDPERVRRARRALRTEALVRELKRRARVDVLQPPEQLARAGGSEVAAPSRRPSIDS